MKVGTLASVKTTESGGPRGYDAAKKIKGRKRHIVTDTGGLLVGAEVHPADVQDRDGTVLVIEAIHQLFPWLRHLFADSPPKKNLRSRNLDRPRHSNRALADRIEHKLDEIGTGSSARTRIVSGTEFAEDSSLEEDRFELPVPPKTPGVRAVALSRSRRLSFAEKPLPDLLGALRRFGIGAQSMSRPSAGIPRYGDVDAFRLGGGVLQM
jgi:hypothetical protein